MNFLYYKIVRWKYNIFYVPVWLNNTDRWNVVVTVGIIIITKKKHVMYYYNRRLDLIVPSHLYSVTGILSTAGVQELYHLCYYNIVLLCFICNFFFEFHLYLFGVSKIFFYHIILLFSSAPILNSFLKRCLILSSWERFWFMLALRQNVFGRFFVFSTLMKKEIIFSSRYYLYIIINSNNYTKRILFIN